MNQIFEALKQDNIQPSLHTLTAMITAYGEDQQFDAMDKLYLLDYTTEIILEIPQIP
jgi:hypothetical protein